jgi:chaperone required for assembly of F1-ATPase
MKRFYKTAEAGTAPGGYVVRLDGKILKTPLRNVILLQSKALAEAMAAEWAHQGEAVNPDTMPITKLANTMVDKAKGPDRAPMEAQLVEYGASDLVCYHATHPEKLVKLHKEKWSPLIQWLNESYDIGLEMVSGIQYHQQPKEAVETLKKLIMNLTPEDFIVVQAATATTGSFVIALALQAERISPHEAYEAACVDEIYQLETWGADALAQERLDNIHADLDSIAQFRTLVKATS